MNKKAGYRPGYYGKKKQSPDQWVDNYFKKWAKEEAEAEKKQEKKIIQFPTISFSRQIGVGALEIADLLAQTIHYRVVDREIMEHMAEDSNLSVKLIELFDEKYPGRISEWLAMITREKPFIKSDYARQLAKTVTAMASTEPTIFVGRGTHYILPWDFNLSVRIICSKKYRIDRLVDLLNIDISEAEKHLDRCDREQEQFFKTVYQKEEISFDGFDLIINRDYFKDAVHVAKIISCAFEQKFGSEYILSTKTSA